MFVPCTDPSTVWEEYQAGLLWERAGDTYFPALGWSKAGIEWYLQRQNNLKDARIFKYYED